MAGIFRGTPGRGPFFVAENSRTLDEPDGTAATLAAGFRGIALLPDEVPARSGDQQRRRHNEGGDQPYRLRHPVCQRGQIVYVGEMVDDVGGLGIGLRRVPVDLNRMLEAARASGMPHLDWWKSKWDRCPREGSDEFT